MSKFKVGDLVKLKGAATFHDPMVVAEVWTNTRGEVFCDCHVHEMGRIGTARVHDELLVPWDRER